MTHIIMQVQNFCPLESFQIWICNSLLEEKKMNVSEDNKRSAQWTLHICFSKEISNHKLSLSRHESLISVERKSQPSMFTLFVSGTFNIEFEPHLRSRGGRSELTELWLFSQYITTTPSRTRFSEDQRVRATYARENILNYVRTCSSQFWQHLSVRIGVRRTKEGIFPPSFSSQHFSGILSLIFFTLDDRRVWMSIHLLHLLHSTTLLLNEIFLLCKYFLMVHSLFNVIAYIIQFFMFALAPAHSSYHPFYTYYAYLSAFRNVKIWCSMFYSLQS